MKCQAYLHWSFTFKSDPFLSQFSWCGSHFLIHFGYSRGQSEPGTCSLCAQCCTKAKKRDRHSKERCGRNTAIGQRKTILLKDLLTNYKGEKIAIAALKLDGMRRNWENGRKVFEWQWHYYTELKAYVLKPGRSSRCTNNK